MLSGPSPESDLFFSLGLQLLLKPLQDVTSPGTHSRYFSSGLVLIQSPQPLLESLQDL